MWNLISLVLGLFGSYLLGRYAVRGLPYDAIRPHARSALRSVLVLHRGLLRLSRSINRLDSDTPDARFESLQAQVQNQVDVAASTIADWRDVIPGDYEEVVSTLELRDNGREEREYGDAN